MCFTTVLRIEKLKLTRVRSFNKFQSQKSLSLIVFKIQQQLPYNTLYYLNFLNSKLSLQSPKKCIFPFHKCQKESLSCYPNSPISTIVIFTEFRLLLLFPSHHSQTVSWVFPLGFNTSLILLFAHNIPLQFVLLLDFTSTLGISHFTNLQPLA